MNLLRIVFIPFNAVITTAIILFDGTVETCRKIKFSLGSGTASEMSEYMQMVQRFFQWHIGKFVDRMSALKNILFRTTNSQTRGEKVNRVSNTRPKV